MLKAGQQGGLHAVDFFCQVILSIDILLEAASGQDLPGKLQDLVVFLVELAMLLPVLKLPRFHGRVNIGGHLWFELAEQSGYLVFQCEFIQ